MKRLLGILIIAMFVLVSCAHKDVSKSDEACGSKEAHACTEACDHSADKADCATKEDHVCTEACDHSADKAMAKDHVCTEACDHSADAMAKDHECSDECKAECKAAHMEKHGADHVCTDECKAECKMKAAHGEEAPEAGHEGGEDKD